MICPDCMQDTLEPRYRLLKPPMILDGPPMPPVWQACALACSACKAYYYILAHETLEEARMRIEPYIPSSRRKGKRPDCQ